MSGCPELSVGAGGRQLGKQIFIDVPADILFIEAVHGLVEFIKRIHYLGELLGCGYLEYGVAHILGIRTVFVVVDLFDERENAVLDGLEHLFRRKVSEVRPFELLPFHRAVPHFVFPVENALEGDPEHDGFLGMGVVEIVEVPYEHQIGYLLYDVQRICQTAGPEYLP